MLVALSACEVDEDGCPDAKRHLCENIEGQACNTATMENAVNKVKEACSSSEAASFQSAAESYCRSAENFDVDHCAELPEG